MKISAVIFAGALTVATSAASFADGERIIDLSYPYDDSTVYWPNADKLKRETINEGMTDLGFFYSAFKFSMAEHGGTHLDAPYHFDRNGQTLEQIPLENLVGDAVVIDVSAKALQDRDYLIGRADIEAWEAAHGRLPDGIILLFRTGWGGRYWPDAEGYLGTAERGQEATQYLHFPGLNPDAARWLTADRNVKAVGIDTASIDYGQSRTYQTHQILAAKNIPIFENVGYVDGLPETGFRIVALPVKIAGGSGGPLRIIAIVPEQ